MIDKADLSHNFDAAVSDLRRGDVAIVTQDGKPLARLTALTDGDIAKLNRKAAFRRMMDLFEGQTPVNIGPWTREELYERGPE